MQRRKQRLLLSTAVTTASFILALLPTPIVPINTIEYPKYSYENLTGVDWCNAGASLSEARGVCTDPDQLIQATACDCFACVYPDRREYSLSVYPNLQLCEEVEESFYLSTTDFANEEEIYTYLNVRAPDDPPTSPALGDVYVGCITKELLEFLRVNDVASSSSTSSSTTRRDTTVTTDTPYTTDDPTETTDTTTNRDTTVTTDGTTLTSDGGTTTTDSDTTASTDGDTTPDSTSDVLFPFAEYESDEEEEDEPTSWVTLYALHADAGDERNEIVTTLLRIPAGENSLSIRVWDLGDGCHENWHPLNTDGGPVGAGIQEYRDENRPLQRSAAVYCNLEGEGGEDEGGACESIVGVGYGRVRYPGQTEFFPVDRFFKPSICLDNYLAYNSEGVELKFSMNTSEEILTSQRCLSTCREEGYEAAMISPINCYCVQDVSTALPLSHFVSQNFCEVCKDSNSFTDPLECGSLAGGSVSFYYVQPNSEFPANHGFSYWQCVGQPLYNKIEDVLPERMFSVDRREGEASQCLSKCREEGFNVAMVMNVNVEELDAHPHLYDCYCLSEKYRFRSMDVDYSCLNYWCPSVQGPCSPGGQTGAEGDQFNGAVFCSGDACGTEILMPDTVSGVCEQDGADAKVTDSRLGLKEYLQCIHDPNKDHWKWELRECKGDNEVFDVNIADCAVVTQGQFCRQTDSRGSEWFALAGDTAVKSCEEDLGEGATGEAFWYCDPATVPLFGTEEPDRSDCQEAWVGDVVNLIEDNTPAKEINEFILENLETSEQPVSGGGLIGLSSTLDDITRLQAQQLAEGGGGDVDGEDAYAASAYAVLDSLLGSVQSWQEILNQDDRTAAASALIRQVDAAGVITVAELASSREDIDECSTVSQRYSNYALLDAELVRDPNLATADGNDDDDDDFNLFIFKSDGVEVRVPKSFLSISDALGCGSVVAAGIEIDYAATQMFPLSPPSPSDLEEEGGDQDNVVHDGLHGKLVDFTSVGVAFRQEGRDTGDTVGTCGTGGSYEEDVVIIFDHIRRRDKRPVCSWWDYRALNWTDSGCCLDRRRSTADSAVCRCNHLTNFAIIFGADDADDPVLSIISIIFGTISCACFLVTILITHLLGQQRQERRHLVALNRNYCIMIGQLLFLSVVGARDNISALACTFVTAITHYVWIAAFTWIALEGYLLFVALVVVFDRGHHGKPWQFFLGGYGVPFLLVGITVGTAAIKKDIYDGYFREDACWLDGGYLWAFTGPVAAVLFFNTIILIKAMMEAYRVNQQRNGGEEDEHWASFKSTLRNFLLLSYMLGITWAFGYFNTFGRASQYIFVFLNATTGVVVLAQTILFNKKTREASIAKVFKSRSGSTKSTKLSVPSEEQQRRVSKATSLNMYDNGKLVSVKKRY